MPQMQYPDHFQIRMVRTDGTIKWRATHLYVGEALIGEPVGLEEVEWKTWHLRFGPLRLATIDETGPEPTLTPTPNP